MNIRHRDTGDLFLIGPAQAARQFQLFRQIQRRAGEERQRLRFGILLFIPVICIASDRIGRDERDIHALLRGVEINVAVFIKCTDHEIEHAVKITGDAQFLRELLGLVLRIAATGICRYGGRKLTDIGVAIGINGIETHISGNR